MKAEEVAALGARFTETSKLLAGVEKAVENGDMAFPLGFEGLRLVLPALRTYVADLRATLEGRARLAAATETAAEPEARPSRRGAVLEAVEAAIAAGLPGGGDTAAEAWKAWAVEEGLKPGSVLAAVRKIKERRKHEKNEGARLEVVDAALDKAAQEAREGEVESAE